MVVTVLIAVASVIVTYWLQWKNIRMRREIRWYQQITAALIAEEARRQRAEERQVEEWMG